MFRPSHQRCNSLPSAETLALDDVVKTSSHRRCTSLVDLSFLKEQEEKEKQKKKELQEQQAQVIKVKKQMNKEKCQNKSFNSCIPCRKLHQRFIVSKEGGPCDRCIKSKREGCCVFDVQKRRGPSKGWQGRRRKREAAKRLATAVEDKEAEMKDKAMQQNLDLPYPLGFGIDAPLTTSVMVPVPKGLVLPSIPHALAPSTPSSSSQAQASVVTPSDLVNTLLLDGAARPYSSAIGADGEAPTTSSSSSSLSSFVPAPPQPQPQVDTNGLTLDTELANLLQEHPIFDMYTMPSDPIITSPSPTLTDPAFMAATTPPPRLNMPLHHVKSEAIHHHVKSEDIDIHHHPIVQQVKQEVPLNLDLFPIRTGLHQPQVDASPLIDSWMNFSVYGATC